MAFFDPAGRDSSAITPALSAAPRDRAARDAQTVDDTRGFRLFARRAEAQHGATHQFTDAYAQQRRQCARSACS
ncbi:MAG: hypothetical protein CPDRYMAC_5143 [uncultured Paraburkholderia sp.]|nr:MAG: hypothetical protein CPDRYMAC_5143 [uncultured Paraburkholderia sp.]